LGSAVAYCPLFKSIFGAGLAVIAIVASWFETRGVAVLLTNNALVDIRKRPLS